MEGIALRYGFFYGPKRWYCEEGAVADQVRRQKVPIVGQAEGVWSWIHIVDAALATVAALTVPPGICLWLDIKVGNFSPRTARFQVACKVGNFWLQPILAGH